MTDTGINIEERKYYKYRLVLYRIKHGLILFSFLNLLQRVGIEINPYWIDQEGLDQCKEPTLQDDPDLYRVAPIDKSQVLRLYHLLRWDTSELKERLKSDFHGVGLYRGKDLAAIMMMRFESFSFKGNRIRLSQNEAYLENMYTFDNFRGRNLAPYLRYQCYKMLAEQGKDVCYSVTQYFNKSSRRFKEKLNARHKGFWLQIGLFKRYRYTILLRSYNLK